MAEINLHEKELELQRYKVELAILQKTLHGVELDFAEGEEHQGMLANKKLKLKEDIAHIEGHIEFLEEKTNAPKYRPDTA